uniref:Uncharacterized protein n=1 Tax=Mustela putorius furo TaxID=9669 RepID=M3XU05_MUSPF
MAPPGCSFPSSNSPLTLELSRCGDPLLLTPGHSPNLSLSFTQAQPQVRPTAPLVTRPPFITWSVWLPSRTPPGRPVDVTF